jgi:hypothetical protein
MRNSEISIPWDFLIPGFNKVHCGAARETVSALFFFGLFSSACQRKQQKGGGRRFERKDGD